MVDRVREHDDSDSGMSDIESIHNAKSVIRLVTRLSEIANDDLGDISVLARLALRTIHYEAFQHGEYFAMLADSVEKRE